MNGSLVIGIVVAIILIVAIVKIVKAIYGKKIREEEIQRDSDLLDAVKRGDGVTVQRLVEEGADIYHEHGAILLENAIKNCDKGIISFLLDKGVDVNFVYEGRVPLACANDEEIIALLKSRGAKTKAELDEAKSEREREAKEMREAAKKDKEAWEARQREEATRREEQEREAREKEERERKEVEREKDRFVDACLDNNVAYVKSALEKYKQLADAKDEHGITVLILASTKGNKEIVDLLISHGADVNMQCETIQNESALICAAYSGHKEIVELLLANGALINAKKSDGMNALMWASSRGYKGVAELLIDKGADVNGKDSEGFSALMLAAQEGHINLVELLINKGAKVNSKNYYDGTAMKLAYKGNHLDIVELLKRNGAWN